MTMTLDKATNFLRMLQNGQIDRRPIGEWIGLREACGVILAHLTQPAQSVDVEKVREVIARLRSFRSNTPPTWAHLDDAADKLEAALLESKP